jgi:hypothetical protein
MVIAFVLGHPAVTAVIVGPRTMEHPESQLAAADVELPGDVLDRVDEIVPPATTINPADGAAINGAAVAVSDAATAGRSVRQPARRR